jgi:hypothetical protein
MTLYDAISIIDGAISADEDQFAEACQFLINTGAAWTMPGRYGRLCQWMVDDGFCSVPRDNSVDIAHNIH